MSTDMFSDPAETISPVEYVIRRTARHFGVSMSEMMQDIRLEPIAKVRQAAYLLAYDLTTFGQVQIARHFKRDGSTFCLGMMKAQQRTLVDPEYRRELQQLHAELSAELDRAKVAYERTLKAMLDGRDLPIAVPGDLEDAA